jgi:hypothetical protein
MEWEGDEGNQPVPAWSCNPVSMRQKPWSVSHIQSRNWVHMGIVRIHYVYSILISRWCNFKLCAGRLTLFSHHQRCFLTRASRQLGKSQSQCTENGTWKETKGRRRNKYWNFDTCKKGHEMNTSRDYTSHGIDDSMELDTNFNFPKIHLISHWVEQIRRYGALQ